MTSDHKIRTNRANAQASTGPKTTQGRRRSARNALRHAFSLPVYSSKALSEDVDALARELAGEGATSEIQELARRVAEAQIDLRRVRDARHQLLSKALGKRLYDSGANIREKMKLLSLFFRPNRPDIPIEVISRFMTEPPQGPEKWAVILFRELHQLSTLDRYERRAISRRKFALRTLEPFWQNEAKFINIFNDCVGAGVDRPSQDGHGLGTTMADADGPSQSATLYASTAPNPEHASTDQINCQPRTEP